MLDGKFSVYNNNDSMQGPPPEKKQPSPLNFKYETLQSSTLSFDEELRAAMEKFHKAKQPSPVKVAVFKFVQDGYTKLFDSKEVKEQKPKPKVIIAAPKPKKDPLAPVLKTISEKSDQVKRGFESVVDAVVYPIESLVLAIVKAIKVPIDFVVNHPVNGYVKDFFVRCSDKLDQWGDKAGEAYKKFAAYLDHKRELLAEKIRESILDRLEKYSELLEEKLKNAAERTRKVAEDILDTIYEMIPFEKLAEIQAYFMDILPQQILTASLWIASFVPTESIKYGFQSGLKKMAAFMGYMGGFAKKSYDFIAKRSRKLKEFLLSFLLPLFHQLETWLRRLGAYLLKLAVALADGVQNSLLYLYRNFMKLPHYLVRLVKGLTRKAGHLTLWIASKVSS